jgi:hypothetical protein
MKSIYKKMISLKNIYINDYSKRISLFMLLFFVVFGIASLYLLLNTSS